MFLLYTAAICDHVSDSTILGVYNISGTTDNFVILSLSKIPSYMCTLSISPVKSEPIYKSLVVLGNSTTTDKFSF